VEVAGRPLVAWSLAAFARAPSVDAVVIAAPSGCEGDIAAVVPAGLDAQVVAGGGTRAESVGRALALVEADVVAVHDAARPVLTPELVERLLVRLMNSREADGVIAAAPITDTVKRVRPGTGEEILRTERRDELWAAQTPQAFRTAALRRAHDVGSQRLAVATDDAMLVEQAGGRVLVEASPGPNPKLTAPGDLALIELLLSA
jgi:2-C-methyl-D-erythritol 4-phosphate cytidylyltransferase